MSFEKFKAECLELIGKKAKLEQPPEEVNMNIGLACPCFQFGKKAAKQAKNLEKKIRNKNKKYVKKVNSDGPYLNFYINWETFTPLALKQTELKEKKKGHILLEHTSMNPSGPVHVGRLRNSIIGDTLKRILKAVGYDVRTHYYVNDMGKQVAMIAWAKEHIKPDKKLIKQYEKYKNKQDFQTMFYYVAGNKKHKKKTIDKMLERVEKGDKTMLKKLRAVSKKCLKGQKQVLKRLNIQFDKFDYESTFVENGAVDKAISKLKKQNVLTKKNGMTGLDLSPYGIKRRTGITPLLRTNKTTVYITRDIAYHLDKSKKSDWLINVVGEDHKVEMKELKTIIQEIFEQEVKFNIIHYAFVNFKGMQLSTRKGQTAPLDMLLDQGIKKARKILEKNNLENKKSTAQKVVVAAIRYYLINKQKDKQINFVWDHALNFQGRTGPYLQYTYVRAHSILNKSNKDPHMGILEKEEEKALIKKLSYFSHVLKKSANQLEPHTIANYTYELASLFNNYYHKHKVIGSLKEQERLALVSSVAETMKKGIDLLGIKTLKKM